MTTAVPVRFVVYINQKFVHRIHRPSRAFVIEILKGKTMTLFELPAVEFKA
jgi:hypothetical protein